MIQFVVTAVSRRSSSQVNTTKYTYPEGKERQAVRTPGAEWEEVEFQVVEEDKPNISIANIAGNGFIVNQPVKLLINNPELFGTYKIGDRIPFISQRSL